MGVYINMEMPKSCVGCKLWTMQIIGGKGYDICRASDKVVNAPYSKPDWCPLIEVPEPHGDLIDASEKIRVQMYDDEYEDFHTVEMTIDDLLGQGWVEADAPTVIPASEEAE